jgi:hypothetical protein
VEWRGSNPYFLVILQESQEPFTLDLDEPQWMTLHADRLSGPALWELVLKDGARVVTRFFMEPDATPFYTCRHFGVIGEEGEVLCYGIGQRREDQESGLWVLPDGSVVNSSLVDQMGAALSRPSP